jgi:hypothetical protein
MVRQEVQIQVMAVAVDLMVVRLAQEDQELW